MAHLPVELPRKLLTPALVMSLHSTYSSFQLKNYFPSLESGHGGRNNREYGRQNLSSLMEGKRLS